MRLYKIQVDLHRRVEVEVMAETEDEGRQMARSSASERWPAADAWTTEILSATEIELDVGARIAHELFGPGTVHAVSPLASSGRRRLFRVTVHFDSGDSKDLVLPHASIGPAPHA